MTVSSTTANTISLSWSVPSGSVVHSYEVKWEREGSNSSITSTTITDGSTSYTIRGLEAEANYTITVAASNGAGSAVSDPVTGTTGRAGSMMCVDAFTPYIAWAACGSSFRQGDSSGRSTGACTMINAMHTSVRSCCLT